MAFITFAFGLQKEFFAGQEMPLELVNIPGWGLGLANAGIIIVTYGLAGALGLWLGHKAGLPGMFRPTTGWRAWFGMPMRPGLGIGILMVVGDRIFVALGPWDGFPHPSFPMSLLASGVAGIGEEIMFRGFMMGLWAFLLNLLFKRSENPITALWIANGIATLAFIAGHLPTSLLLFGVHSPLELPLAVLADLIVLNGMVALVAGERYMHAGLIAAMGVHFWADIVWHVIWPLFK